MAVRPWKRDLEAPQRPVECGEQILACNPGCGAFEPSEARASAALRFALDETHAHETAPRGVFIEHLAFPVDHGDRIGDRLHEQPEIALG